MIIWRGHFQVTADTLSACRIDEGGTDSLRNYICIIFFKFWSSSYVCVLLNLLLNNFLVLQQTEIEIDILIYCIYFHDSHQRNSESDILTIREELLLTDLISKIFISQLLNPDIWRDPVIYTGVVVWCTSWYIMNINYLWYISCRKYQSCALVCASDYLLSLFCLLL